LGRKVSISLHRLIIIDLLFKKFCDKSSVTYLAMHSLSSAESPVRNHSMGSNTFSEYLQLKDVKEGAF
jgi:hypothetical protein